MITLTLDEYVSALKSQNVDMKDATVQCPKCKTLQSISDFVNTGAIKNLDEAGKHFGSACIGRFDNKKGCDWSLGGLLQFHELEILYPDGSIGPRFIPTSAEQRL